MAMTPPPPPQLVTVYIFCMGSFGLNFFLNFLFGVTNSFKGKTFLEKNVNMIWMSLSCIVTVLKTFLVNNVNGSLVNSIFTVVYFSTMKHAD